MNELANAVILDFGEFLDDNGYSTATKTNYRLDLRSLLDFLESKRRFRDWSSVTTADLAAYVEYMTADKHWSDNTRCRRIQSFKTFFAYLCEIGTRSDDPALAIPHEWSWQNKEQPILTYEQVEQLLAAPLARGEDRWALFDAALLQLLCGTGMRLREILQIKLDDLDLDTSTLIAARGKKKERVVPLDDEVRAAIVAYLERGRKPKTLAQLANRYLLPGTAGNPFDTKDAILVLKSYGTEMGFCCDAPLLRHTYAVHILAHGQDVATVNHLLGNLKTELDHGYPQAVKKLATR